MTPTPEKFDWVTARFECSLMKVFGRLSLGVKADVETRKELEADGATLEFYSSNDKAFMVSMTHGRATWRVDFLIKEDRIVIEGFGVNLTASPGLNTGGVCTLIVNGTELELWQVRRLALDRLFFGA